MEVGKRGISHIFNYSNMLEIPFFQRSYVWEEENWERFLDDITLISTNGEDYFMGAVILKQQPTLVGKQTLRIIIDGQQRLTTIVLFFRELCLAQSKWNNYKHMFFSMDGDEILLKHNHNDIDVFERIAKSQQFLSLNEKSKIVECYKFFHSKREELQKLNFDRILQYLFFVVIDLGQNENEQRIFDTINSLGVSLTAAELLKNELYSREDSDLYDQTWRKCFEGERREFWYQTPQSSNRTNIDLLLYSHLLSLKTDKNEPSLQKTDNLFSNYKYIIKERELKDTKKRNLYEKFIHNLVDSSTLYFDNIKPDITGEIFEWNSHTDRLNATVFGLEFATTSIPYILYLFKDVSDKNERNKMLLLLETFLSRRLICKESTRPYFAFFASLIRENIKTYSNLISKMQKSIAGGIPNNPTLENAFLMNPAPKNSQAKTILYMIEKSLRSEKDSTDLQPLSNYSLEHVMPRNWGKNWQGGNLDEEAQEKRNGYVRNFGNLTIITSKLNASIRDADWQKKKKELRKYSAGIKIFDTPDYLQSNEWNEEKIEDRATFFFERAREIWPYPS
ncbi:MAG: DUF262 domain-containing protein [Thermodesulfobacteriota bacterium]